ncbi:hypothetical protein GN157_03360 [Flavobacterium rakeshii]|uniref:KAP NTPase domain-containing protein n=1 Tax=Flavobacterium rakeshii TaxID=1038845 RepID=A0A6N8HDM8_9FLAO|nr:P-loop NTPase fold protein [Flavobacterium rakeshii]MEE1897849.1 P-loop NTPase fold protein [Flavobacterium rakeshii]MUV02738.1 hypothetical protein [Flavobacterium rakeshii]
MTTPRLLSNLPVEQLTNETDYLGLLDKADIIKAILINNKEQFNEIKMFSLYGEWGSGKSSLMKYLQTELKSDFNTFFFEAWEFEKDENLAYSLIEFLASENRDALGETCDEILKFGGRVLRGLGKSIKMNIPLFPGGPGVELDPAAFVEEVSKEEELTFYKALENFKKEFVRLEDKIIAKSEQKYNIVFIDDLDRCEPEQVLNLLSAIKLFFTYGEKTIFFCGIDKKAVEEAVRTKYGEVIKANEYLEKIFDISFTMPYYNSLRLLLNKYFGDRIYESAGVKLKMSGWIEDFLVKLDFTNPRRVKKVLNKFALLRNVKKLNVLDDFPNIDVDEDNNSLFETLLVFYLIILHEFYHDFYNGFVNYSYKKVTFNRQYKKDLQSSNDSVRPYYLEKLSNESLINTPFKQFYQDAAILNNDDFVLTICPSNFEELVKTPSLLYRKSFIVKGNMIELNFYNYLMLNIHVLTQDKNLSASTFKSAKDIITRAL